MDPLNPHGIADTRKNAYTRYTILAIIQCLIDYADSEFTRDTVESIPRARRLYEKAEELLNSPELIEGSKECDNIMGMLEIDLFDGDLKPLHARIRNEVANIASIEQRKKIANDIKKVVKKSTNFSDKITSIWKVIKKSKSGAETTMSQLLQKKTKTIEDLQRNLVTNDLLYSKIINFRDTNITTRADTSYLPYFIGSSAFEFCIPKNPVVDILRTKVKTSLAKIRTCKNIAGVSHAIDPFAAPTDTRSGMPYLAEGQIVLPGIAAIQPSQYRFKTLIERAKQLQTYAERLESALINVLEKQDQARYNILKARQDLDMAKAGVNLQKLRVNEATAGVDLANSQKKSATTRYNHYDELLGSGWLTSENDALNMLISVASMHGTIAAGYTAYSIAGFIIGMGGAGYDAAQKAVQYTASALQTTASILSTVASYERRAKEWEFQRNLANNDIAVGVDQVELANAHKEVINEEKRIAELSVQNAEDTLEFLNSKFGTAELYDWMGKVLRQLYAYFLQQSTSMAQAASNQLAFERQKPPPPLIKTDYWKEKLEFVK